MSNGPEEGHLLEQDRKRSRRRWRSTEKVPGKEGLRTRDNRGRS